MTTDPKELLAIADRLWDVIRSHPSWESARKKLSIAELRGMVYAMQENSEAIAARQPASDAGKVGGELKDRDNTKPDTEQGLFRKFDVIRIDGSHQEGRKHFGCRYFVIDIDHDPIAPAALTTYANEVEATHPLLAADMRKEYALASAGIANAEPAGEVVITTNEAGTECYVVSRQDEEGHILSVIWEKPEAEPGKCVMGMHDDTDPVMADLKDLNEDGYATDKQRATARLAYKEITKLRAALQSLPVCKCAAGSEYAERYRWLRDDAQFAERGAPICISSANTRGHAQSILSEDELDAAIDKARKGEA